MPAPSSVAFVQSYSDMDDITPKLRHTAKEHRCLDDCLQQSAGCDEIGESNISTACQASMPSSRSSSVDTFDANSKRDMWENGALSDVVSKSCAEGFSPVRAKRHMLDRKTLSFVVTTPTRSFVVSCTHDATLADLILLSAHSGGFQEGLPNCEAQLFDGKVLAQSTVSAALGIDDELTLLSRSYLAQGMHIHVWARICRQACSQ